MKNLPKCSKEGEKEDSSDGERVNVEENQAV